MDQLNALRCFIEVAKQGNFSAAAKALGKPSSSVSRLIQDLEAELGVGLFHRTTRTVRLTEMGELYLEEIRPAIATLDSATELVQDTPNEVSGHLRISVITDFGKMKVLPALDVFRKQHPDIVIDIELTDQLSDISNQEVDIAIRATANPPERTIAKKLVDTHFRLVASPGYLKTKGTPKTLEQLSQHKTLVYRKPNGLLYWQFKTDEAWQETRLPMAFASNQGEALLEEALKGTGIALLPKWALAEFIDQGRLKEIILEDAQPTISRNPEAAIYLLYQRRKYNLSKVKAAVDFLLQELTED